MKKSHIKRRSRSSSRGYRSRKSESRFDSEVEELQQRLNELKRRHRSSSSGSSHYSHSKRRKRSLDRSPRGTASDRGSRSPASTTQERSSRSPSSVYNLDRSSRSPAKVTNDPQIPLLGSLTPPLNTTQAPSLEPNSVVLPDTVKTCLGKDPEASLIEVFEPHIELSRRVNHILAKGLDKDVKVELLSKYPIPQNVNIGAPVVNPEIVAGMNPAAIARDKHQIAIQNDLERGIGCLMLAVNKMLLAGSGTVEKIEFLPLLSDTLRYLCDLQHTLSLQRRTFINNGLSKSVVELSNSIPVGQLLYGQDFGEKIKASKAAERSAKDIVTNQEKFKYPVRQVSRTVPKNLNYHRPLRFKPRDHRQQGQASDNTKYKYYRNRTYQSKPMNELNYRKRK